MSQPATRRFRRQCQGTRCRLALAVGTAVAVLVFGCGGTDDPRAYPGTHRSLEDLLLSDCGLSMSCDPGTQPGHTTLTLDRLIQIW